MHKIFSDINSALLLPSDPTNNAEMVQWSSLQSIAVCTVLTVKCLVGEWDKLLNVGSSID